jgi:pyruvate ferredoxin oxidoreductase gamma subunit
MFRIRIHGRGGQGIKTASQILGTAFFLESHEVQDAPRYGAERRGAPIFAYVRAARHPINERGVISRPDLVVVADDTLVPIPAAGVLQGLAKHAVVLLCSDLPVDTWRARLPLCKAVLTLPLGDEAANHGALPHLGARCAGAAARLVGVIRRDTLQQALEEELAKVGTMAAADSVRQALAAFDAMAPHAGLVTAGLPIAAAGYHPPAWVDLPLDVADVAAPDIHVALTSVFANTGSWRTRTPVIDYEHCNRCSWICGTLCPDGAIAVGPDHVPSIDLDHCKGCLVCVAVCPPHAIRAVPVAALRSEGVAA